MINIKKVLRIKRYFYLFFIIKKRNFLYFEIYFITISFIYPNKK